MLNYGKRLARKSREKQGIGQLAATLVDDGDCIAVDTGTTTIELVRNLNPKLAITIMTNDFAIADLAEEILPNARVLFLGGVMRRGYRYTSGSEVLWGMERYRTDKAFLGKWLYGRRRLHLRRPRAGLGQAFLRKAGSPDVCAH